ncbi:MAG: ATP-dependent DNA helicase RecG [Hyphomicrobiales bacterium]|nr:MAG: ATP-dependent DNA helicase RecG [Hyphomicrobiales bacterium]
MRPDILTPLYQSARVLPKIGPKIARTLGRLTRGVEGEDARVMDLLFHKPYGIIDRRHQPGVAHAQDGQIATLHLHIDQHIPSPRHNKRVPYRVHTHDDTGEMDLVFFHAHASYLEKLLPVGEVRYVSGTVEWFRDQAQMVHPDHMLTAAEFDTMPMVEAVYPMTAGVSKKILAVAVAAAVELVPELPEWLDKELVRRERWEPFQPSLQKLHAPESADDLEPGNKYRSRLAYDELLATQLALSITRQKMRKQKGMARVFAGKHGDKILAALPFELTNSQKLAVKEIAQDLKQPERMLRLLQGDVGSGKTLVGLLAMADVVEAGAQAGFMAPTELLARQHFQTMAPLCEAAGLTIAILTGKDKQSHRKPVLAALAAGEIDILVGTHALFQDSVAFQNLGMIVVDEQHRFGVHQRLALSSKGNAVDVLVMTATPIPRTLVLTYFGDMDVSKLTEKPAGRQPIDTRTVSMDRIEDVLHGLSRALHEGKKAYWVCPLVEEAEVLELTSAETRFDTLKAEFGDRVGLVHGRMTPAEKDAAMESFKSGQTRILVATTVIEVGVDVPDATIMVIEHAERFGLSQLHQLRGRVGRGTESSSCVLLYKGPLGETAKARLTILRDTEDGFRIAEEDLKLRGEGEVLGTRQSGAPTFRIADLQFHADLLEMARKDSRLILEMDPDMASERGKALRVLLYLFGLDEAIRYLKAG